MHSDETNATDHAQRTSRWRTLGLVLGPLVALGILLLPRPEGLSLEGQHTAAVGALMALWWLGNILPMAVTALIPLIAFPLLGVASLGDTARPYAHPLIFLMLGGFLLGHGMERVGLHARLTTTLLSIRWVRQSPRRVLLALMTSTAVLSGLVSNTATTVMMLPLALHLATVCGSRSSPFALGLAYAASIGGTWTLVGTPPNAVLAGQPGVELGFATWMAIGVPFAVISLPLAWLTVSRLMMTETSSLVSPPPSAPAWNPGERAVLTVVACAMTAWLTRAPVWSAWVPGRGSELDAVVALLAGLAIFLLPGREGPLTTWRAAEAAVPWSVLLLLGGGFSLAGQIKATGLTNWIASGTSGLQGLPEPAVVGIVCLAMTFTTELTSNTASTQIVLPILQEAANTLGIAPLMLMVPATLSASCAFMMPVATGPNAIAAEAGGVHPTEMARAGLVLNGLLVVVTIGVGVLLTPWVLGA